MIDNVYIGLGSNLGDGLQTLQAAWRQISETKGVEAVRLSSPYLSAPVGMESSNWFTNAVGHVKTKLSPPQLLQLLLDIESSFGRRRDADTEGYQDRTLDLDIIYFGEQRAEDEQLILPHPHLNDRLFVLEPLAEIAANFCDPADGLTPPYKLEKLNRRMEEGTVALQEIKRGRWPGMARIRG